MDVNCERKRNEGIGRITAGGMDKNPSRVRPRRYPVRQVLPKQKTPPTENLTLTAINIFDDHDIIVCCQLILNLSIHPFICAFSIVSLAPLHINVGRLRFIRGRVYASAHLPGDRRGRMEVLHALPAAHAAGR